MRKLTLSAALISLFFLLLLANSACDKAVGKLPKQTVVTVANVCDSVTYSSKIKKMIETSCGITDCHEAGFPNGDFSTYAGVKSKVDAGTFKQRVFDTPSNPMPPTSNGGMLSSDKLQLIKCWLDKGAKND
jgi:hypothetical protein